MSQCPHCSAPSDGIEDGDGRIQCGRCEKWYRARRPPPPVAPQQPKPAPKPKLAAVPYDPPEFLPDDLLRLGFKFVHYRDSSVAVSSEWGCSNRSANLEEIIASARNVVGFIRWMRNKHG